MFISRWWLLISVVMVMISVMCGGEVYSLMVVNFELLVKLRLVISGIFSVFRFFWVVCVLSIRVNGMKLIIIGMVVCRLCRNLVCGVVL